MIASTPRPSFGGHRLDATGDVAQRVDVEAAVDLVEHRELRLEHRELQRLGALLLAARELDVHAALEELLRDTEARRLRRRSRAVELAVGVAALTAERGGEEVAEPHTGNLDGVLQREEQTARGALVRGERRAAPRRRW